MKTEFRNQLLEWRTAWEVCLKGWSFGQGGMIRLEDGQTFQDWYSASGYGGDPAEIEAAIKSFENIGIFNFVSRLEEHETTPSERVSDDS